MSVIYYTAKREVIDPIDQDEEVFLEVCFQGMDETINASRDDVESMSGRTFSSLHNVKSTLSLATRPYKEKEKQAKIREFFYSVVGGEIFEIDFFGTEEEPDNPRTFKMVSRSLRQNAVGHASEMIFSYSFEVEEV